MPDRTISGVIGFISNSPGANSGTNIEFLTSDRIEVGRLIRFNLPSGGGTGLNHVANPCVRVTNANALLQGGIAARHTMPVVFQVRVTTVHSDSSVNIFFREIINDPDDNVNR